MTSVLTRQNRKSSFRRILGIRFFVGTAAQAVQMVENGGLVVVPAAPALKNIVSDLGYRDALLQSDLAITDSSFMVLAWNLIQKDSIARLSGLEYLVALLASFRVRPKRCFWIMASEASATKNLAWLRTQGIEVSPDDVYVAPRYGAHIEDTNLLEQAKERRPDHVIVTLGGGTQEKLGLYLKKNVKPLPAVHCIGAAIAFLSGDQVRIPLWADRLYLGWLFRCLTEPRRYFPRYWSARKTLPLILRYREKLPGYSGQLR